MENSKEIANQIAAFLNKHGGNRKNLAINGYEFKINGFSNVDIPSESIHILQDGAIQFNGSALVKRLDTASKIGSDSEVSFYGVAFFAQDIHNDDSLLHISIDQIKTI